MDNSLAKLPNSEETPNHATRRKNYRPAIFAVVLLLIAGAVAFIFALNHNKKPDNNSDNTTAAETSKEEKSEEKIVSLLGEGKEIVVGYDVSLLMDDVPVLPSGKVLITLPFFASDYPYSDLVVVYIDDEGNTTLCETITTSEGYIAFYTDHSADRHRESGEGISRDGDHDDFMIGCAAVLQGGEDVHADQTKRQSDQQTACDPFDEKL